MSKKKSKKYMTPEELDVRLSKVVLINDNIEIGIGSDVDMRIISRHDRKIKKMKAELDRILRKIIKKYRKFKKEKLGLKTDDMLKWAVKNNVQIAFMVGDDLEQISALIYKDGKLEKVDGGVVAVKLSKADSKLVKRLIKRLKEVGK